MDDLAGRGHECVCISLKQSIGREKEHARIYKGQIRFRYNLLYSKYSRLVEYGPAGDVDS